MLRYGLAVALQDAIAYVQVDRNRGNEKKCDEECGNKGEGRKN